MLSNHLALPYHTSRTFMIVSASRIIIHKPGITKLEFATIEHSKILSLIYYTRSTHELMYHYRTFAFHSGRSSLAHNAFHMATASWHSHASNGFTMHCKKHCFARNKFWDFYLYFYWYFYWYFGLKCCNFGNLASTGLLVNLNLVNDIFSDF